MILRSRPHPRARLSNPDYLGCRLCTPSSADPARYIHAAPRPTSVKATAPSADSPPKLSTMIPVSPAAASRSMLVAPLAVARRRLVRHFAAPCPLGSQAGPRSPGSSPRSLLPRLSAAPRPIRAATSTFPQFPGSPPWSDKPRQCDSHRHIPSPVRMWALVAPYPAASPTVSPAGPLCLASPKWGLLGQCFRRLRSGRW